MESSARGREELPSSGRTNGMLGVLIGFVPWIVFWVVAGAGFITAALLARLAVSLIQNLVRLRARNLKTLEVVTLVFAVLDVALTLGAGSTFFRSYGGIAVNATLAAMAFGTLLAGSPFTYQYARDDWPREYWTNPLFRRTNEIITAAWGGCFLLCGAFDGLTRAWPSQRTLWSIILPSLLTLAAALFSIRFPRWVTLHEMARRIAERDPFRWAMPSFDGNHADDEHDVIVVGAGIGGLTAAALLARRGLKVLVFEQHSRPGGYCSSWRRATPAGAFLFDAGVHDISGLGPKGPVRNLLRQLGVEQAISWLRVGQEYLIDGSRLRVPPEAASFAASLGERFPAEREGIKRLFAEVEAVYREMYADVERTGGVPCPPETPEERLAYPCTHPTMVRWMDRPFSELIDTFVRDERLKKVFHALSGYLSDNPSALTVGEMTPIFGYYFDGGFYPKGGSQALADALVDSLGRSGGRILLRTGVRTICLRDGRVAGVETTTGAHHRARVVLSNADVRRTFLELVGEQHLPADFAAKIKAVAPSPSAFAVFLGVDFVPDVEPITIMEGSGAIAIPSKLDPSLAPQGHASMTLLRLIPAQECSAWNRESPDYEAQKRRLGDELIARAETVIPELREHIVYRQEASPASFGRYAWATDGAIYGPARGQWRPPARSPIEGLMIVGAGAFPGSGVEGVVISGTLAADAVRSQMRRHEQPAVAIA